MSSDNLLDDFLFDSNPNDRQMFDSSSSSSDSSIHQNGNNNISSSSKTTFPINDPIVHDGNRNESLNDQNVFSPIPSNGNGIIDVSPFHTKSFGNHSSISRETQNHHNTASLSPPHPSPSTSTPHPGTSPSSSSPSPVSSVLSSSPLPRPLLRPLLTLSSTLHSLHTNHTISSLLRDMSTTVDIHNREIQIEYLRNQLSDVNSHFKSREISFRQTFPSLTNDISLLTDTLHSLSDSNGHLINTFNRINNSILSLQNMENIFLSKMSSKSVQQDVTLIPHSALKIILSHCSLNELIPCIRVCRRWNFVFNVGLSWKIVTLQLVKRVLVMKSGGGGSSSHHNSHSHSSVSSTNNQKYPLPTFAGGPPPSDDFTSPVTVTLSGGLHNRPSSLASSKPSPLSKQEIFTYCLKHLQRQIDGITGQWEEMRGKWNVHESTMKILYNERDDGGHRVGLLNVEEGEWVEKTRMIALEKRKIGRQMSELDDKIRFEQEMRDKMKSDGTMKVKKIDHSLELLKGVGLMVQNQMGNAEKKKEEVREQKISDLQMKKKILVKGIKEMRKVIESTKREKMEYENKIQEIKNKIRGMD